MGQQIAVVKAMSLFSQRQSNVCILCGVHIFFVASSCYLICAPAGGVADRQKLGCSSYQQREHTEFISCASICAPRVYVCVGVCVQPPKAHKYTHQVYAALAQHKSAAAAAAGQVDYGQHRCMAEMFGLTPQ